MKLEKQRIAIEGVRQDNGILIEEGALALPEEPLPVMYEFSHELLLGYATNFERIHMDDEGKATVICDIEVTNRDLVEKFTRISPEEMKSRFEWAVSCRDVNKRSYGAYDNIESAKIRGISFIPVMQHMIPTPTDEPLPPLTLKQQLQATLHKIELQIDVIGRQGNRMGIDAEDVQTPDGRWPMVDLLAAKATVLNALVTYEATERIKNR